MIEAGSASRDRSTISVANSVLINMVRPFGEDLVYTPPGGGSGTATLQTAVPALGLTPGSTLDQVTDAIADQLAPKESSVDFTAVPTFSAAALAGVFPLGTEAGPGDLIRTADTGLYYRMLPGTSDARLTASWEEERVRVGNDLFSDDAISGNAVRGAISNFITRTEANDLDQIVRANARSDSLGGLDPDTSSLSTFQGVKNFLDQVPVTTQFTGGYEAILGYTNIYYQNEVQPTLPAVTNADTRRELAIVKILADSNAPRAEIEAAEAELIGHYYVAAIDLNVYGLIKRQASAIGRGNTLPVDMSLYPTFVLSTGGALPGGTYSVSASAGQWVEGVEVSLPPATTVGQKESIGTQQFEAVGDNGRFVWVKDLQVDPPPVYVPLPDGDTTIAAFTADQYEAGSEGYDGTTGQLRTLTMQPANDPNNWIADSRSTRLYETEAKRVAKDPFTPQDEELVGIVGAKILYRYDADTDTFLPLNPDNPDFKITLLEHLGITDPSREVIRLDNGNLVSLGDVVTPDSVVSVSTRSGVGVGNAGAGYDDNEGTVANLQSASWQIYYLNLDSDLLTAGQQGFRMHRVVVVASSTGSWGLSGWGSGGTGTFTFERTGVIQNITALNFGEGSGVRTNINEVYGYAREAPNQISIGGTTPAQGQYVEFSPQVLGQLGLPVTQTIWEVIINSGLEGWELRPEGSFSYNVLTDKPLIPTELKQLLADNTNLQLDPIPVNALEAVEAIADLAKNGGKIRFSDENRIGPSLALGDPLNRLWLLESAENHLLVRTDGTEKFEDFNALLGNQTTFVWHLLSESVSSTHNASDVIPSGFYSLSLNSGIILKQIGAIPQVDAGELRTIWTVVPSTVAAGILAADANAYDDRTVFHPDLMEYRSYAGGVLAETIAAAPNTSYIRAGNAYWHDGTTEHQFVSGAIRHHGEVAALTTGNLIPLFPAGNEASPRDTLSVAGTIYRMRLGAANADDPASWEIDSVPLDRFDSRAANEPPVIGRINAYATEADVPPISTFPAVDTDQAIALVFRDTGLTRMYIPNAAGDAWELLPSTDNTFKTATNNYQVKSGDRLRWPDGVTLDLDELKIDGAYAVLAPYNTDKDWLTHTGTYSVSDPTRLFPGQADKLVTAGSDLVTIEYNQVNDAFFAFVGGDSYSAVTRTVDNLAALTALDVTQYELGTLVTVSKDPVDANNGAYVASSTTAAATVPDYWKKG